MHSRRLFVEQLRQKFTVKLLKRSTGMKFLRKVAKSFESRLYFILFLLNWTRRKRKSFTFPSFLFLSSTSFFRRNRLSVGWSELQNTVKINWNVHEEELFKLMEKLIKSWEGDERSDSVKMQSQLYHWNRWTPLFAFEIWRKLQFLWLWIKWN